MYAVSVDDILESKTDITKVAKSDPIIKKANTSRKKGNRYENEIAKQLGTWIFNDIHVFQRSLTSGAKKAVYCGDIVPQKQLPGWTRFSLYIECKNGYKDNIPTFNNYAIIEKWLVKCLEDRTAEQPIILLIARFHNYSSILITDTPLTINWNLCVNIEYQGNMYLFYSYKLDQVFAKPFKEIFSPEVINFLTT